jgi:PAS domain S-box-containing protein
MDYYSYVSFFAAIIYLYFGICVYSLDKKSSLNRAFAVMCLALMLKSFFSVFVYNSADEAACIYWHNIADIGWNLFPAAALTFFIIFSEESSYLSNKLTAAFIYSPWLIFIIKSFAGGLDDIVAFEKNGHGGFYTFNNSSPNAIDLYFVIYSLIGIYFMVKSLKKGGSNRFKKQSQLLIYSSALTLAAGVFCDIALPLAGYDGFPLMAHIIVLIWFFGVWYAVKNYKLMTLTPALLSEDIISNIMDFIVITGPDHNIIFTNARTVELSGFSFDELNAKKIYSLIGINPGEIEYAGKKKTGLSSKVIESWLKTSSGETLPVKVIVSAIYDEWNDLKGYMICGSDERITRRLEAEIDSHKKSEQELLLSRQRYQMLADSLPQTVFETGLDGRLTYVNRSAFDFFRYNQQDFDNGLYIFQMVHPSDLQRAKENTAELIAMKQPPAFIGREYRMIRKDKTTFDAIVHSYAMLCDGKPRGICGIIVDITELKNARERLEKINDELDYKVKERTAELAFANEKLKSEILNREKMESETSKISKIELLGILVGGIVHDFNNFLMGVVGNLTLLKKKIENDPKALEIIKRAEEVSFNAKALTRQLLTFSKENMPMTSPARIDKMLKDASAFTLRGSNYECRFNFDAELPYAQIDENLMNQVFTNLIINASQSMPDGGIIEIGASNYAVGEDIYLPLNKGEYIRVYIKDSGCGIAEKDLPRIFDPYFTTKAAGSGLGLTSAFAITRKHGGLITVESKEGEGASFFVYLPVSVLQGESTDSGADENFESVSGRVLLLDDEVFIREAISDILKSFGLEVDCCANGAQAVELYKKAFDDSREYDILLLDLTIPGGMGGIEALENIKKISPDAVAIASSGYYSGSVRNDYNRIGFKAFLSKPYKIDELYKLIKKLMIKN